MKHKKYMIQKKILGGQAFNLISVSGYINKIKFTFYDERIISGGILELN